MTLPLMVTLAVRRTRWPSQSDYEELDGERDIYI